MQSVFMTAFKKAAEKYSAKYLAKKNGFPPTEEFNNLHLEDGKVKKDATSESDSTSSNDKWSSLQETRKKTYIFRIRTLPCLWTSEKESETDA